MNGHIFDIEPTQADRYIKTKKELVGYISRTYSNLTKKSIETLTHKLAIIMGPSMPTKQVTDPITNVKITVDKLGPIMMASLYVRVSIDFLVRFE